MIINLGFRLDSNPDKEHRDQEQRATFAGMTMEGE